MKSRAAVSLLVAASLALSSFAAPFAASVAWAQQRPGKALAIVRDAETEQLLQDYAQPIFKAAGIRTGAVQIVLINDRQFNAFVADGTHMFINTGALVDAKTPNEIIGVIAHESGHIAGGHLVRMRDALAKAQTLAAIGMAMGVGAIAAGAATRTQAGINGGVAAISAGNAMAERTFLAYVRTEEMSADAAAIRFLEKTGQSANGMLVTFSRFANEVLLSQQGIDPYLQTHPMPQERVSQLEDLARKSPYFAVKDPPALQARHDMMRAKLIAFTEAPQVVARSYPASDMSRPARYARAIVAMKTRAPADAVAAIDGLIADDPNNPWFRELKGQALIEAGRPAEAIAPLRQAVALAPDAGQLRIMLGRALVATEEPTKVTEGAGMLEAATTRDKLDSSLYQYLARAYGLMKQNGKADLMVARGLYAEGNAAEARKYAARAQGQLKVGSPDWVKAGDLVGAKGDTP